MSPRDTPEHRGAEATGCSPPETRRAALTSTAGQGPGEPEGEALPLTSLPLLTLYGNISVTTCCCT